jgi:hypothetical protein
MFKLDDDGDDNVDCGRRGAECLDDVGDKIAFVLVAKACVREKEAADAVNTKVQVFMIVCRLVLVGRSGRLFLALS